MTKTATRLTPQAVSPRLVRHIGVQQLDRPVLSITTNDVGEHMLLELDPGQARHLLAAMAKWVASEKIWAK